MRTHVSFRGDFDQDIGDPPGAELAAIVRDALADVGLTVDHVVPSSFAHTFFVEHDGARIEVAVGYVGDEEREWLVFVEPAMGVIGRIRHRGDVEEATRRAIRAMHRVLTTEPRIREVRWFEPDEWNDPLGLGTPTPDG